jgi:hypothetical protein
MKAPHNPRAQPGTTVCLAASRLPLCLANDHDHARYVAYDAPFAKQSWGMPGERADNALNTGGGGRPAGVPGCGAATGYVP